MSTKLKWQGINPCLIPIPDTSASSVQALWVEANQSAKFAMWLLTGKEQ
jgi:hypothetical protein